MHSERWAPVFRHCISSTLLDFYFDEKSGRIPRSLRNLIIFNFFVDSSIVDAKLDFVPSYSVVSDALIDCMHL